MKIDPQLDTPFFHKETSSWPWYISEDDHGHLEDTMGGNPKKAKKVRHTAEGISETRSSHDITSADAWLEGDDLVIRVYEFNAAYNDDLLLCCQKGRATAVFHSSSPAPGSLAWQVVNGSLVLKEKAYTAGGVLHGKVDVTLREIRSDGPTRVLKFRAYFKPMIRAGKEA